MRGLRWGLNPLHNTQGMSFWHLTNLTNSDCQGPSGFWLILTILSLCGHQRMSWREILILLVRSTCTKSCGCVKLVNVVNLGFTRRVCKSKLQLYWHVSHLLEVSHPWEWKLAFFFIILLQNLHHDHDHQSSSSSLSSLFGKSCYMFLCVSLSHLIAAHQAAQ